MSAKSVETDGVAVPNRAAPAAILSPAESAKRISDQLESHVHSGERSVELVCFLLGELLDCCYGISSVAASLAAMIDADWLGWLRRRPPSPRSRRNRCRIDA